MKEVHLQDDPYVGGGLKDCKLVVTRYESGYYEGSGEALVLTDDDRVVYGDLGHCSCYGSFENFLEGGGVPLAEFLADNESVLDSWSDELDKRFREELELLRVEEQLQSVPSTD